SLSTQKARRFGALFMLDSSSPRQQKRACNSTFSFSGWSPYSSPSSQTPKTRPKWRVFVVPPYLVPPIMRTRRFGCVLVIDSHFPHLLPPLSSLATPFLHPCPDPTFSPTLHSFFC